MKQLLQIFTLFFTGLSTVAWSNPSPIPMLQSTANQIIATLEQNKGQLKNHPGIIYQAVETHLLPHVDVNGMSRSVLGRQAWMKATPTEKQQFTHEFTQLVMRTYASPLSEFSGEKIKFLPIRSDVNGRFIRVNSMIIRPNGNQIPVSYSLVSINNQWKIYDLSVEGVSLLQSFRTQFADVLQNSSMQKLITDMKQKQLKNKAA